MQSVLVLAGHGLRTWLHALSPLEPGKSVSTGTDPRVTPPHSPPSTEAATPLTTDEGLVMTVMARCAHMHKDLAQAVAQVVGGGAGGCTAVPPPGLTAATALLGAAGKGLVTRVLPLGMLLSALEERPGCEVGRGVGAAAAAKVTVSCGCGGEAGSCCSPGTVVVFSPRCVCSCS